VPQPLRHDLERLAGRQRRGRVAVAHPVQGDRRQAGIPYQPREPLGDLLGVEDLAVLVREDQAGVDPGRPPRQALLELPDPVRLQGGRGERVEGELPAAGGGLGLGHHHRSLVHDHDRLDDGEPPGRGLQVDRPPGQAEQLAAAHPGGGEQQPHRGQAVLAGGLQEGTELLGRPHGPLPTGHARRVSGIRDVAGGQAPAHRITKGLVQQDMDMPDALGLEPAAAVPPAMLCKVGVQAVKVAGRQRLQRDVAQRWKDLRFGVDAVGRPGGRPDGRPHGREPLLGKEGTQRQPGRLHEGAGPQGGHGLVEGSLRLPLGAEPALAQLPPPSGCRIRYAEVPGPGGPALSSTTPHRGCSAAVADSPSSEERPSISRRRAVGT
jgi:hypothetical protein